MNNIVDLAWQIIEMQRVIDWQARELDRLQGIEEQYNTLLMDGIQHGEKMMGNLLQVLTTPGVAQCFIKNQSAGDQP